ncbi:MAG: hypothetical protein HQM16_11345 [Deltaproteobacteria bacterium]|nr:hypothetical protein [Deltaproteobacteria bacterium]
MSKISFSIADFMRCLVGVALFFCVAGCASSLTQSGTGDTNLESGGAEPLALPPTIAKLSPRISAMADALIPYVSSEGADPDVSAGPYLGVTTAGAGGLYLDYADDNAWATYLDPGNAAESTAEKIFGPDNGDGSRLRTMIGNFEELMLGVFEQEQGTEFTCYGDLSVSLESVDEIAMAFYGTVQNGTAGDRDYDCVMDQDNDDGHHVTLYGMDSDYVVRVAHMYDTSELSNNGKGHQNNLSVMMATYAERVTDDVTTGYLDLNMNFSVYYLGVDEQEGTSDDSSYKVRSRITGVSLFDGNDNASSSSGDFSAIQYNWNNNGDNKYSATQSAGRGGYDEGEFSLFWIRQYSTDEEESTVDDYFCLEHAAQGTDPANVDSANCTNHETAYAWATGTEFPFDLTPALTATFSDITKFEANDTDLISDAGDNFVIPDF